MSPPKPPPGFELDAAPPPPPEGFEVDAPGVQPAPEPPMKLEEADEATKDAYAKERRLENFLTFFANGGPAAAMKGFQSATLWPHPASGRKGDEGPLDLYRRTRDETKRAMGMAERHGPQVEVAGVRFNPVAVAGAAAPAILAPNPATLGGRFMLGAFLGGEQAAIQSDADLTRGEVGPLLQDTGRGAALGLGAAGLGEAITAPMRAISRGAASRIGDVVADQATKDAAVVEKEVAALRGQLGGESQKMSRMFENTQRAASGGVPPVGSSPIDPALQSKAIQALSDPSTARLQEKVIERGLQEMPSQAALVGRLEQELARRAAGAGTEAAQRTSEFFAKPTLATDVLPRVGRQLQNAATSTAAAIPAAIGAGLGYGKMGAGAMLLAGASHGLSKGALSAARTTLGNPRLQVGALESLIQASQAAQRGQQAMSRAVPATALRTNVSEEEERSIQAFLTGS